MSLLQEVAKIGQTYCEYNQALLSIQNLDNGQKMRLVKQILEDVYTNVEEKQKKIVTTYIVHYKMQGEEYSKRFYSDVPANSFARKYNGTIVKGEMTL
jgi:hypothetical protein